MWIDLIIEYVAGFAFAFKFVAGQAGTFFYHSHDHPDRQQSLGLYGALIIDLADTRSEPRADHEYVLQLQEWLKRDGLTYPAMLMEGALPNYFTINGRSYPATDLVRMRVGETMKLRFIGTNNNFIHPMHVHGGPFVVIARDGVALGRLCCCSTSPVDVSAQRASLSASHNPQRLEPAVAHEKRKEGARSQEFRRPREGGDPVSFGERHWISAFAGMTV
jgi:FtsP/CotA-like multicopper oxidase with cupredoxin domain